jgi:DNA segregation ATPase FtsK/SpoIIIE-like protein
MLNGGAPRMGKTIFLLYLSTVLYLQTNGNIELHITSPKLKDFYPLFNLPNVKTAKDEIDFLLLLNDLITEYKKRNELLYSSKFKKATDAKSIRQFYPDHYHLFKPIFLIIDEYARFSHLKDVQTMVAELVQTAGFVNVHVIIATQRPEAKQTLPANIKMGLMTRICFKTADENNSIVILDESGAEQLSNHKGRAILKDGESFTVQIPFLSYDKCEELLKPFERKMINEQLPNQENKGSENINVSNKIQDMFAESTHINVFPEQQHSCERVQQDNEKINNGWFRLESTKRKG